MQLSSALTPLANAGMRPPQPSEETRKLTAVDVALLIAIAAMTGGWICALGWVGLQLIGLI
jgi:hypothetical protein